MNMNESQVTEEQIRRLETQAGEAGDHAMVLIAWIAVGDVELDADTDLNSLPIAKFIAADDMQYIRTLTRQSAWDRSEKVILDARDEWAYEMAND